MVKNKTDKSSRNAGDVPDLQPKKRIEKHPKMKTENLRTGQLDALRIVLERIAKREPATSIVLPTRYGKSDLIRLIAYQAKQDRTSSGALALSPNRLLRKQIVNEKKVKDMIDRYEINAELANKLRSLTSPSDLNPFSNGEYLLSATMQLACQNISIFAHLAEHQAQQPNGPLVVHIDECHQTSEDKRWGELVSALQGKGALVVLYTATAIRADGEYIPGFEVETLSETDARRHAARDAGDGVNNWIDVYHGVKKVVRLRADHETTFKQAWNENPSPICKLSHEVIGVFLNDLFEGEEHVKLSEASETKARKYLATAVRNPTVISEGVTRFLRELLNRKKVNEAAAGIIFTCNDLGAASNEHAHQIRDEIEKQQDDLDVRIVTMKSEDSDSDEKACEQIERFVGQDGKHGKGDVLIVKQMGGAGLDAPRIKVVLDLSNVRTVASVIQRLMRVATPWNGMNCGSVITLDDPLMTAIWDKYVIAQGGEAPTSDICQDWELVKSYLKEKTEDALKPLLEITRAELSAFDDNTGTNGDLARHKAVDLLLNDLPILGNTYSKAELASLPFIKMMTGENPISSDARVSSLDNEIRERQRQIDLRIRALIKRDIAAGKLIYNRDQQDDYRRQYAFYMAGAKTRAGVPETTKLQNISNIRTLEIMMNGLAE